jgi:molybdate transport system substrate-binding protein
MFMHATRFIFAFACLLHPPVFADEIRVAVASNFAPTLEKLAARFETTTAHTLTLISGSSGKHYAQITNGAPFDVFFSADSERPIKLEQENNAIAGSRFTYALGKLVLWSPNPDLIDASGEALNQNRFRHLAIANPKLAPYGLAAQQTLQQLGRWEALAPRLVRGENIEQCLQFVTSGNAELGFVAWSQIVANDELKTGSYWQVPTHLYSPIAQQAVLLKDTPAAREFLNFVRSAEARKMIQTSGYDTP